MYNARDDMDVQDKFVDWIDAECMDGEWHDEDQFTEYVMKNMPREFDHLDAEYVALTIGEAFQGYVEMMQDYANDNRIS